RRFTMARTLSDRRTFRPHLEALEERWCPAMVDYFRLGDTLSVRGTPGNDRIEILDRGAGDVSLKAAGGVAAAFHDIRRVVVRTGNGNDFVSYKVQSGPGTTPADIDLDLGRGDDSFALDSPVVRGPGDVEGWIPDGDRPVIHVAESETWGVT